MKNHSHDGSIFLSKRDSIIIFGKSSYNIVEGV